MDNTLPGPRFVCYTDLTYWKKDTEDAFGDLLSDLDNTPICDDSEHSDIGETSNEEQEESEGDLLEGQSSAARPTDDSTAGSSPIRQAKRKRKPKRKGVNNFFLDEAVDAYDVDECFQATQAEDEEDSSLDGFIVRSDEEEDEEEEVEEGKENHKESAEDHLNYLRSLQNTHAGSGKFKLQYAFDPNQDVYSQAITAQEEAENEYEMDSFCDDEIVFDSETDGGNISTRAAPSPGIKLRSKKRIGRKGETPPREASTPKVEKTKAKKKKRRRVIIESP